MNKIYPSSLMLGVEEDRRLPSPNSRDEVFPPPVQSC